MSARWSLRRTETISGFNEAYMRENPLNVDRVIYVDRFRGRTGDSLVHYVVYKLDRSAHEYTLVQRYGKLESAKQRVRRDEARARQG
jgi:hypothetical protein